MKTWQENIIKWVGKIVRRKVQMSRKNGRGRKYVQLGAGMGKKIDEPSIMCICMNAIMYVCIM